MKVTSDKKIFCKSYQRDKGENSDYCSPFSVICETTSRFLIVFVKLVLRKKKGLIECLIEFPSDN